MPANKKSKLLIVEQEQFGGLTDCVKWCQYLCDSYDVTHIGLRRTYHTPDLPVHVVRVSTSGPRALRGLRLLATAYMRMLRHRGPVIVVYFPHCIWLKRLMPWRRMHLDVRTMCVFADPAARAAYDAGIRAAAQAFDTVTAISPGVADAVRRADVSLLPLGADVISDSPKNYAGGMRLLYVGSLYDRHIDDTLRGLAMFRSKNPDADIHYTIVGDGPGTEKADLEALASELGLTDVVTMAGRVPYKDLGPYFAAANIGVSYVPMVDYYQNQPPTKTYEYLLSGLYTMATATTANCAIFGDASGSALHGADIASVGGGVLHRDTPQAFAAALHQAQRTLPSLRCSDFPDLSGSTWSAIVSKYLVPLLA